MKKFFITILILLLIILGLFGFVQYLKSTTNNEIEKPNDQKPEIIEDVLLDIPFKTQTKVGQTINYLSNVERKIPLVSNEGLTNYPLYGNKNTYTLEEKEAFLSENELLVSSNTTYDEMDEFGNLYLNGVKLDKKLYKHTASENLYNFNVDDSELAYEAMVKIKSRQLGNYITGLYAPAGEVIKIEVSEEYLNKVGSFDLIIGQVSQRGHVINIPTNRDFTRMPIITNKMRITKPVSYVGSYFGGPIYIGEPTNKEYFEVKISGGVKYPYFILGETTRERFEENAISSAKYFDLEVFDDSVRHSGPFDTISDFTYEDCYNTANLWEMISTLSNQVPSNSHGGCGISFVYDTHVMAGGAVALVGANYVNAPISWMRGGLYYDDFVLNGSWGSVHEYNHHYQQFGIIEGNETTNNAVNLLNYATYTNISANRTLKDSDLTGWNEYTDASRSLRILLDSSSKQTNISNLSSYSTLIHSFGVEKFLEAARSGESGVEGWFKKLVEVTNLDMTYYFENILKHTLSTELKDWVSNKNLKMYVPVSTIYQTGQIYDDYEFETMKPFYVDVNNTYRLNLQERIIIPSDISFNVLDILSDDVEITKIDDYNYDLNFKKDLNEIILKLDLIKDNLDIYDATLKLEFKKEYNKFNVTQYSISNPDLSNIELTNKILDTKYNKLEFIGTNNTVFEFDGIVDNLNKGIYEIEASNFNDFIIEIKHNDKLYKLDKSNNKINLEINSSDILMFNGLVNTINQTKGVVTYKLIGHDKQVFDQRLLDFEKIDNPYKINYLYDLGEVYIDQFVEAINFTPWDENYKTDYMFDGVNDKYMHSRNMITNESPFELIVKLDEIKKINFLKFYGYYMSGNEHIPTTFDLYISLDNINYELINSYSNLTIKNKELEVRFKETDALYIKLIVYKTSSNKYVALNDLEIGFKEGNIYSPDYLNYYNEIEYKNDLNSYFGHLISAKLIKQTLSGNKFIIYGNSKNLRLSVKINGVEEIIDVLNTSNDIIYKIDLLEETNIEIKVLEGILDISHYVN